MYLHSTLVPRVVVLITALSTLFSAPVSVADSSLAPWQKTCSEFSTPKQYVSDSVLYCLRQQNSRACHTEASAKYSKCGFGKDYARVSKKIHAKMIVLIALAGTRPLAEGAWGGNGTS